MLRLLGFGDKFPFQKLGAEQYKGVTRLAANRITLFQNRPRTVANYCGAGSEEGLVDADSNLHLRPSLDRGILKTEQCNTFV